MGGDLCTIVDKTLDTESFYAKQYEKSKEDRMELFFSPLACSMSGRIALAEAGANVKLTEVDPHTKRVLATGEDYSVINPLGYVPALRLDDGTVLTENAAILQYIADAFPAAQLAPPEIRSPGARETASVAELHQQRTAQGADDAAARPRHPGRSQGVDHEQIRLTPCLSQ
jgi:glutathione S-transferase